MTILSIVCTKLLCTNAHLGRRVADHHFKVYIRGSRNGIAILDSDKTLICLRNALHFIGSPIRQKGRSFFLKTNHLFRYEIMEEMASCINDSQWKIGAFFTNSFANKKKFHSRKKKINFGLNQQPDCAVILNADRKSSVILEADRSQIPIASLVDSTIPWESHKRITYPIPANDPIQFVYLFRHSITKTVILERPIIQKMKVDRPRALRHFTLSTGSRSAGIRPYSSTSSSSPKGKNKSTLFFFSLTMLMAISTKKAIQLRYRLGRSIWKGSFVDAFLFRIKKNRESLDGFKLDLFPIYPNYIYFIFIGFLVLFWVSYVGAYGIMFPNKDPKDLPNPLQVAAQLSCFFFLFKYKRGDVRQRHLCLLILFFCIEGSLYLQGVPVAFLFGFFIFYSINIFFFPLDQSEKAFFLLLCGYCIDPHLSRWGFYLVFEQLCYFFLSFFLEKEQQPCALVRLFSFIILLLIQLFCGFFYYQDFDLMEPLRLASLLSGACIVFLSIKRRAMWELIVSFFLYLLVASIIAIVVSPKSPTTLLGVPSGIFIFGLIHFWFVILLFCIFLKEGSLRGQQPLIPLFFSVVFYILPHLPEVDWLERWIEGADLLLLILAIFAVIENGKENGKTPVRRGGSCVAAGIEDEDSGKGGS